MADRLEDLLRRMLEGPMPPPPPRDRKTTRSDVLEAQVVDVEETAEARQPVTAVEATPAPMVATAPEPSLPKRAISAAEIAQLLRSPERIREAIILNEILKRPAEW